MAFWHLFGTKQKGCQRFAMRLPSGCYQMSQTIQRHLPQLRESQLTGLTLWVYGAILMGSACQNAVATSLSFMGSFATMRQYLRQWLYDGQHRPRPTTTQVDVELCFAPLLRWVLELWQADRLALAVDPTMKGDQLNSIVISVVYRSCAIRVAWHVLAANRAGEWISPALRLIDLLADAVPGHMSAVAMCDRGLRSAGSSPARAQRSSSSTGDSPQSELAPLIPSPVASLRVKVHLPPSCVVKPV